MDKTFTIKGYTDQYEVRLMKSKYTSNGRLAISATEEDGQPFGLLTVNLPDDDCPENHAYLDTNNIPDVERFIKDNELGKFTGEYGYSGFCEYPLYEIFVDKF